MIILTRKHMPLFGLLVLGGVISFTALGLYTGRIGGTALFQQALSLRTGTLIRAEDDERIYYIEDGKKRQFESSEVFRAQGFNLEHVTTAPSREIAQYPDGERIQIHSLLILPQEHGSLPDIAPLAPYQLRLGKVNGRTVLRFTGSFWNQGDQPFHLLPGELGTGTIPGDRAPVYERIVAVDHTVRMMLIDNFVYHPAHQHLHLEDFGYYMFQPIRSASGALVAGQPFVQDKTTFCMRDDERMPSSLPGIPPRPVFLSCGTKGQGVSVGWIDVYPYTLPDQFVDVQDMPPGVYGLSFMLDPKQHYLESRKDNNIATTFVDLDVAHGTVKVLASLAPFNTPKNTFLDGTLIRTAETGNVYVLNGGRKRWLRSVGVFNSYGYAWDSVYPVTRSMVDAIPYQNLIRERGGTDVYALNENGYRRRILNPAVFASYRFSGADVADVSPEEFALYPEATLIMRAGDDTVYSIAGSERRRVGMIEALRNERYELSGLHVINDADFAAYTEVSE